VRTPRRRTPCTSNLRIKSGLLGRPRLSTCTDAAPGRPESLIAREYDPVLVPQAAPRPLGPSCFGGGHSEGIVAEGGNQAQPPRASMLWAEGDDLAAPTARARSVSPRGG
jgi:hypothetical protein